MDLVKRIYVSKKPGFDIEANHLKNDIRDNLNINSLETVRILNRYDIEGISDEDYRNCLQTIFSEPPLDDVYEEDFPFDTAHDFVFGVKYLPGQYDQRADSAVQCIQITAGGQPQVDCAKIYVMSGSIRERDKQRIKNYCVNPVDSMETDMSKPESLKLNLAYPADVEIHKGFIEKTDEELRKFAAENSFAMSAEDLLFCRDYFRDTEHREPSVTELRVIDTYWSDHCRHTTFLTRIDKVDFEESEFNEPIKEAYRLYLEERDRLYAGKQKDICLMDIAVMGMKALKKSGKLDNLDESEEINACSIVIAVDKDGIEEEWLIMFKNETHNHPTEIEPFGGAATCLGGAIRDPLSGRSYVYQAMRVTGSGDPRGGTTDTLPGKLPQVKITTGAAHGYSSYGNQIGLATGQVAEIYDEGYIAKRMEIGAVIGAVKKSNVVRERPERGDVILLIGGRTGRDGCGGATGSSKEHTEDSILSCGAEVQKGNPPTERKLQRLFRNPEVSKMVKRCNDFGAGGVAVAIGELAEGLRIDLDAVPKKYDGLDGTELAISESQERMAVVVNKEDAESLIILSKEENLEATEVAEVTDDRRLRMSWRGKEIVNLSRDFLDTNGVKQVTDIFVRSPEELSARENPKNVKQAWLENLSDIRVASQKGLSERFDSTIGSGGVLMPFGGKNQLTPAEALACKVPVGGGKTSTVTLMAYGYNPSIAKRSPFHGAIFAVVDSVTKIVAAGGNPHTIRLTFQEYFEKLGKDPGKWGAPFSALLGGFYAQMKLGMAAIGGKDSMSGTFKDISVPPTLVSFALGIGKTEHIISPEFKKAGHKIVLVRAPQVKYELPDFPALPPIYDKIFELIKAEEIVSASTIGYGGLSASISKMAVGNDIGARITTEENCFKEFYGSFLIELSDKAEAEKLLDGFDYSVIGETIKEKYLSINNEQITLEEILKAWLPPLEKVFPTGMTAPVRQGNIVLPPHKEELKRQSKNKIAKPRVLIPVFPGTNCEDDTKAAFERAGAEVKVVVIKNLNRDWLEASITEVAKLIKNVQIIALPGGFSAGDEPEGSAKFIAAIFRNPGIKEEVSRLLQERDGLMLGICNGFQALLKLGLLPYGEIRDIKQSDPTLTFNEIGRHVSCLAKTKIISNRSPWLYGTQPGDVYSIPVSHGEGRFVCDEAALEQLSENGQIAMQYVDFDGNPTYDIKHNPNGSFYAVEGLISADGRILGKMGHSERIGTSLYKNVEGEKDQKIFESGVNYFC